MSERVGSLEEWARNLNRFAIAEWRQTVEEVAEDWQILYSNVTRSWRIKLAWQVSTAANSQLITGEVQASGSAQAKRIFNWVDEGTGLHGPKRRAYKIPKNPRPETTLRFRTGYRPRTLPTARFNVGPGTASGNWVSAKQVTHPGIRGRKFTETFIEELQPPLKDRVLIAFTRAGRRAAK